LFIFDSWQFPLMRHGLLSVFIVAGFTAAAVASSEFSRLQLAALI
jgi:hypothetical protein